MHTLVTIAHMQADLLCYVLRAVQVNVAPLLTVCEPCPSAAHVTAHSFRRDNCCVLLLVPSDVDTDGACAARRGVRAATRLLLWLGCCLLLQLDGPAAACCSMSDARVGVTQLCQPECGWTSSRGLQQGSERMAACCQAWCVVCGGPGPLVSAKLL
jgi:hypothetical protein